MSDLWLFVMIILLVVVTSYIKDMPPIDTQVPQNNFGQMSTFCKRQPGVQNKREPEGETPSIEHRVLGKGWARGGRVSL